MARTAVKVNAPPGHVEHAQPRIAAHSIQFRRGHHGPGRVHAVMAMRSAVLRQPAVTDPGFLTQWVPWAIFAVVSAVASVWVFERGLQRAYRDGRFIQT